MASFTSISSGLDWQATSFLNELVGAHSERAQAIGQSAVSSTSSGADIQAASYWTAMQNFCDSYCTSFVDHSASISGQTSVPMFTLSSFRSVAGLNSSGWRRATAWVPGAVDGTWQNDVTFLYGTMQAGDIIGPWIFDDLQKAFSALKWTTQTGTSIETKERLGYGATGDCAGSLSAHNTSWAAATWQSAAWSVYSAYVATTDDPISILSFRSKGKVSVSSIPTFLSSSCDVYGKAEATTTYADLDGVADGEDNLFLLEELGESSDATRTTSEYSPSESSPASLYGISCPVSELTAGIVVYTCPAILKWNFSHSN